MEAMLIQNCITPFSQLSTIRKDANVKDALELLQKEGLDTAPVVDENKAFRGITGYRLILKSLLRSGDWGESAWKRPLGDAVESVRPLTLDSDFEEMLPLVVRVPFVPIVEPDQSTLAGIVKISDIETAIARAMGYGVKGIRMLIGVFVDHPHVLDHLLSLLKPFDVNIISVTTFDSGDTAVRRILLKLSPTSRLETICEKLEQHGYRVLSIKQT
ncbi:CBS domain protein [Melghirimyces profundicolus]|uniref:CBS domain protein n=1 Tax=Melghirimyces profundicolus TaxID=1242148 RepID=A0A2T6B3P4_9BACL|nr:CBS domain-containing protein [Melghirimyces profundicolus]PTX50643.1 CBS domain protein [Melghirimyces profundicolus]